MKITIEFEVDSLEELSKKLMAITGEEKKPEFESNSLGQQDSYSQYARLFDSGCETWCTDSEYNLTFLRMQERNCNDMLQLKGYLFLNDVYQALGFKKTKAGQVVGWIYNEENPNGDNFVDFGLTRFATRNAEFLNGYKNVVMLDFNVDGMIVDLI